MVRLQGGLGNQLFEYAAGLHLARERNASLLLVRPEEKGINLFDVLPEDRCAEAPSRLVARFAALGPGDAPVRWLAKKVMRRVPAYRRRYGVLRERPGVARTPSEAEGHHLLLVGWFIQAQWYSPVLADVAGQVLARLQDHPHFALAGEATVVSFRRGDFVRWGWALDTAYYERALQVLDAHGPSTGPYYVVGDDDMFLDFAVDWLRARGRNASRPPRATGSTALADLALLAGANRVVAANSTFCWWGLVAGDAAGHPGRRVVAPEPWIRSSAFGKGRDEVEALLVWDRVKATFTSGPD